MGKTTVIVRGNDPPGYYEPSQPPQQTRPFSPFGGMFRFRIYASSALNALAASHGGRSDIPFDNAQSVTKARTGVR